MKTSAILLAAGFSSRMPDDDKIVLKTLNGDTFLEHIIRQLDSLGLEEIIIVLPYVQFSTREDYDLNTDCKIAINSNPEKGISSSLSEGLKTMNDSSDAFMVCLCDMPLLMEHHYTSLLDFYISLEGDKNIVRPFINDTPGNPVIFSSYYRNEVISHNQGDSNRSIIKKNEFYLTKYNTEEEAFFKDIDTKSDYEAYLRSQ